MDLLPLHVVVNCLGLLKMKVHSIYKQVWTVMYRVPKSKKNTTCMSFKEWPLDGVTSLCFIFPFKHLFCPNPFPSISLTLFKSFSRYIFFLGFNRTFIWKFYKTSLKFIIPKELYPGFLREKENILKVKDFCQNSVE